jgi:glycosyltransferase involved in cell wall biosynthesis
MGIHRSAATKNEIEEVRHRYRLRRPYLLWAGTIEPRKNLVRLIEAFATLDHDLDLALAGPAGWNQDMERLLAGIGIDETLARKLSEAAPGRAARFTWERTADELMNAYREVAA